MKNLSLKICVLTFLLLFVAHSVEASAQICKASGKIGGRNPPPKLCNRDHFSDCCQDGQVYPVFHCSPPVTEHTEAILTLNGFEKGADRGGPSECDNKFHFDNQLIVALSTGWFNRRSRCFNQIVIRGNGRTVKATVVDECDSTAGCDRDHDFQPPCDNNIVDASPAVWKALGVPPSQWGNLKVTWTDA